MWVLGDQLNRGLGALAAADPAATRVLLVESTAKLTSKRWHVQRAHLVVTAMRRFAAELADEGFAVDLRRAPTLARGLAEHRARHRQGQAAGNHFASELKNEQLGEGREHRRNTMKLHVTLLSAAIAEMQEMGWGKY